MKKLPKKISWSSTAVLYFAFLSVGLLAIVIASLHSIYSRNNTTSSSDATNVSITLLPTIAQNILPTASINTGITSTRTIVVPLITPTSVIPSLNQTSPNTPQNPITDTSSLVNTEDVIILVTPSPTATITIPTKTTSTQPFATDPASLLATPTTYISITGEISYTFPVRASEINYGPYHHDYPAADIFCPVDSEFVAPTSGIVDFVSRSDLWDPSTDDPNYRGGLAVAIIGDDGWRYYGSHLTSVAEGIEPGVRVSTGQLLGHTGKSGDARFTPPHLHFGISHPTTPDDWKTRRGEIAPYKYLQAWSHGQMITPEP